jgi:hypothetical protein
MELQTHWVNNPSVQFEGYRRRSKFWQSTWALVGIIVLEGAALLGLNVYRHHKSFQTVQNEYTQIRSGVSTEYYGYLAESRLNTDPQVRAWTMEQLAMLPSDREGRKVQWIWEGLKEHNYQMDNACRKAAHSLSMGDDIPPEVQAFFQDVLEKLPRPITMRDRQNQEIRDQIYQKYQERYETMMKHINPVDTM